MKDRVQSLLEADHQSLNSLLIEIDADINNPDISRIFAQVDRFWARLAVHIRAEHLQLFAVLDKVPARLFSSRNGLPTADEAQELMARLRADHDFFMKELALVIKALRGVVGEEAARREAVVNVSERLRIIRQRLDRHNQIEEEEVYRWPSLLLEETALSELIDGLRHELRNLPPRLD